MFDGKSTTLYLVDSKNGNAQVAQSVEQGTENPCVGGSIPSPGTTFGYKNLLRNKKVFFCLFLILKSNQISKYSKLYFD